MTLDMFKSLLDDPLASTDSFSHYITLLRVLCGKNRSSASVDFKSKPAHNVLAMILKESAPED